MTKTESDIDERTGREIDKDLGAEWEVLSDKKVTPLDPKYQKIRGLSGSLLKITFHKSYGKSKNPATGEIVDSVHYLCHEFPFFVLSLPQAYENEISSKWRSVREYLYRFLIAYLSESSPNTFETAMEPDGPNRWIDEYSTYVVLR